MANDVIPAWQEITKEDIHRSLDKISRFKSFQEPLENATNDFERRKILKEYYTVYGKEIVDSKGVGNVYMLGDSTTRFMTPIELHFFIMTRSLGRCYLFPQYPVGKYYADFANPYHKIIVECDGKQWHDAEKDRLRDIEINELGWTVFRLSGSAIMKNEEEYLEEFYKYVNERCVSEGIEHEKGLFWFMSARLSESPTLLIRMLRYAYFENNYWSRWYRVFLRGQFQSKIYK